MAESAQLNHGAPEASDASASAITSVETRHFRLPLPQPMTDATHGVMTHFEVVMVILEAGGQQGIGYTYTIGLGGKALRALIDDALTPILLGGDAGRGAQIWEQLWWRSHYIGRGGLASFAIAAVDIALWDWRARRANEALWRYLGGAHGRARAYAGGIDLQLSTEGLLEQTQENLERGFRAIKIKVGRERLREDIARVAAVRELIGPDIPLMADANMRWTVEQACRAASALREFELAWLEEPTIPDDYRGHARIAREGVPIATGENLHTLYEFRHMLEWGDIAFPEPDVCNIGGITNWMRVAGLAQARNLPVTSHGVHELHLSLLAAIPNASFLEVHSFGLERFMHNPPALVDGWMRASDAPGHGVKFDWAALAEAEKEARRRVYPAAAAAT